MSKKLVLPVELEAPEKQYVITGAIYSIACFFSLPFLFLLVSDGFHNDIGALSWFEIAFHILNFVVIGKLFKEYLSDSLLALQLHKDTVITVTAITVGVMLGIGLLWHFLYLFTGNEALYLAAFGVIPLSEMDILTLSGHVVITNPVFGTLCMTLLVPVITGCLYYAIGFTPFYNIKPWLGYLVVSLAVAFPRICNAMTYWIPEEELVLYVAQLPVHLVSCWAYRKTDTVWTPIIAHMIVNLIGAVVLIVLYGL